MQKKEDKVITKEYLDKCLYSLNKRAKNYRYELSNRYNATTEKEYRDCYDKKTFLLSFLKPTCIHEIPTKKEFYVNSDYDHFNKKFERAKRKGTLIKYGKGWFKYLKSMPEKKKYFLFYQLPKNSYHIPIKKEELFKYEHLDKVEIDYIYTFEDDPINLIEMDAIDDLINKIKNEDYIIED